MKNKQNDSSLIGFQLTGGIISSTVLLVSPIEAKEEFEWVFKS